MNDTQKPRDIFREHTEDAVKDNKGTHAEDAIAQTIVETHMGTGRSNAVHIGPLKPSKFPNRNARAAATRANRRQGLGPK